MRSLGKGPRRGIALVAVLWIVAALSLLVTGLVQSQRNEIRLTAAMRDAVQANALANAATQILLQALAARTEPVARLSRTSVTYAGVTMGVELVPLNGLIDINRAPAPLMKALLTVAGGMQPPQAEALAQAIVNARGTDLVRGARFEAIEDLLALPGVDYTLYARLSTLITADSRGIGRVNALAAPDSVLLVLAEGDAGRASRIAQARDSGEPGVDTTGLPAQFLDTSAATRFRIAVRVPVADGRQMVSTRYVELGRGLRDGVPWRVFHSEHHFEPAVAGLNRS